MLRYDNKVAIVSGAGGGLGRSHALLLASRGAKVVVNDLGTGLHGDGSNESAAEQVVKEIQAAGGDAVANHDSVVDGEKIVQQALDHYGRVDIIINNAGFLRDVAFHKMSIADWSDMYHVHLEGAFKLIHAAWPHMRNQQYGRIINTSSAAGIYGNFGQANYSSFKLGLHGLTQSLAIEGKAKNVHVNSIAPAADSRLTRTVMTEEQLRKMSPELVSPLVGYLCHESCEESGSIFEVGGAWIGKLRWERTLGAELPHDPYHSPEDVQELWGQITDFSGAEHPADMQEAFKPFAKMMGAG